MERKTEHPKKKGTIIFHPPPFLGSKCQFSRVYSNYRDLYLLNLPNTRLSCEAAGGSWAICSHLFFYGDFLRIGIPWDENCLFFKPPFGITIYNCLQLFPFASKIQIQDWVVVSNICYFHPYLGKWSNLTNIFQMGWNHQLEDKSIPSQ